MKAFWNVLLVWAMMAVFAVAVTHIARTGGDCGDGAALACVLIYITILAIEEANQE